MQAWKHADMQTIVFSSQKGGSGKSGFCSCCGVEAERAGDAPVYFLDGDHQGTLSTWHEIRQAERPHRVEIEIPDLRRITWRNEDERKGEAQALRDGLGQGFGKWRSVMPRCVSSTRRRPITRMWPLPTSLPTLWRFPCGQPRAIYGPSLRR